MPPPTAALQRSEEKYRALLESIDQGFCIIEVLFDEQGRPVDYRFLEANPAFERHTGLRHAVGKRMLELEPAHEEHWFRIYGEVVRTGTPTHFENVARALGRWYEVYAFRIGPEAERRVGVLFNDITRRKRDEELLHEMDRRKDEFIATLAHELKNPLAPVRHSVGILRHPAVTLDIARAAALAMDRQLSHLERLVDDLLHVARITSGKLELLRERIDLNQVVRDAVELSRPRIESGRHELTIDLPPGPVCLAGDAVRLAQVIANLLNNAARYSDEGAPIRVSVSTDGGDAVLRVVDAGSGIAPEALPRIFDMFMQAGARDGSNWDGLGIGLTLVKRLVEAHGGVVEAHSAGPGKGSEFRVRLPLAPSGEERAAAETAAAVDSVPMRRVLVVDDNRDAADTLRTLLELDGHEVQTAYDGGQALAVANGFHPDVVLLDLGLPDMSGHEVARRLSMDPRFADVTLAAVTGWGQPEDRQRTAKAGFGHHLVKPVHPEDLRRVLSSSSGPSR